jgi:hypothetical protein
VFAAFDPLKIANPYSWSRIWAKKPECLAARAGRVRGNDFTPGLLTPEKRYGLAKAAAPDGAATSQNLRAAPAAALRERAGGGS